MLPSGFNPHDMSWFFPLQIRGGLAAALLAAARAWRTEALRLTVLNFLWVLSCFTFVGMAPATATLFFAARHALVGEYIGLDALWYAFRRYLVDSLRWGAVWALVVGIGIANLWFYRDSTGLPIALLRGVWIALLLAWVALNLFFWPFWYAQLPHARTLRTTWRNSLLFFLANPLPALAALLLCAALAFLTLNFLPALLLFTILAIWPALLLTAILAAYLPD